MQFLPYRAIHYVPVLSVEWILSIRVQYVILMLSSRVEWTKPPLRVR